MRNSFQHVIATLNLFQGKQSLTIFLLAAIFALTACDDSSSASDDNNETSAVESSSSVKDSDSTEESSSSIDKKSSGNETKDKSSSSDAKSSSSAKETKNSSDSKSSSSVKSGDSSSSKKDVSSSSSSVKSSNSSSVKQSSSSVALSSSEGPVRSSSSSVKAIPCKTETEDNCEYGTLIDERDGQAYRTVKIGDQWWMAENLNYANLQPTTKLDSSSFCYKDSVEYCEKYGRLYLWSAAMDSAGTWSLSGKGCGFQINGCPLPPPMRGVCPEGWHLPTIEEWRILLKTDNSSTGARLKSTFGWLEDGNGMDSFGFSVLPSAYGWFNYTDNNVFYTVNNVSTSFWSSTDETFSGTMAYQVGFHYINYSPDVRRREKWHAYSVRCLKDSE